MALSKYIALIGTGFALGFFHVLTGPDHLSAIATLSANVGDCQAFYLGVRWGVGHSTGLLLVGTVLILLSLGSRADTVNVPESLSTFFESIVGIFMLLLGSYGLRRACLKRHWQYRNVSIQSSTHPHGTYHDGDGAGELVNRSNNVVSQPGYSDNVDADPDSGGGRFSVQIDEGASESDDDRRVVEERGPFSRRGRFFETVPTRTLAILAGIVHGLAGPGGVLGVIPAVQLHDAKLATTYLASFCFSSTITMGIFAILYGSLSTRIGTTMHSEFQIELLSSSLSILVGVTWLVLLALGKLDDVFP